MNKPDERFRLGFDKGFDTGFKKGFAKGFDEGRAKGENEGRYDGYVRGRAKGHDEGRTKGYDEGYIKGFGEGLADALGDVGVAADQLRQRQRRALGTCISDYLAGRSDWKVGSVESFNQSKSKMLVFFGSNTSIESISTDDAVAFRRELQKKYSQATIARVIRHCWHVFDLVRRRNLIVDNPFDTVKTGS